MLRHWQKLQPSFQFLIVTGALLIVIVGSFAVDQWRRHDNALARTENAVVNAAELLAEHTAWTFNGVDAALRETARVRSEARVADLDKATIQRLLVAILGGTPVLKSVGWVDRDGNRIATSLMSHPPPLDIDDFPAFAALRDGTAPGIHVTEPFLSKMLHVPVFAVGYRLTAADGGFDGVAYAMVDPAYFRQVYREADLGLNSVVTLFRGDGMILARQPDDNGLLGTTLAGRPFMTEIVPSAPSGTFRAFGLGDGEARIIGFASTADGRFIQTVAVRTADATAVFREELRNGIFRLALTVLAFAIGTWVIVRQIRRRERLTSELRQSEAKLRDFAESSGDWFWETNPQHRLTWVSPSIERATGIPVEWFVGKSRTDVLVSNKIAPEVAEEHRQALEQRKAFRDFEYPASGPKGIRWIRTSGVPLFDDVGEFLGYRGSARDVTELVATKERFREAADAIPGGFLLFDAQNRLVYRNSSLHQPLSAVPLGQIGETFEEIVRRTVATGRVREAQDDPEEWIKWRLERFGKAEGSLLVHMGETVIEVIERPTSDGGTMVLRLDVTERERANEALREARDAADTANRAKSEFLANMSHELRTPLNAIIGFGQILKAEGERPLTAQQRGEYSKYIVSSGEHLLKLVNDVLDLSGIEAGRLRIVDQVVSVDDLVEKAILSLRPLAESRNIRLEKNPTTSPLAVRGDEHRLAQVMLNLISNAIKYNRPGGYVMVGTDSSAGRAKITVTDSGPGIPADRKEQLFTPFQRLGAEFTKVEGTGIGLALCKRLLNAMDGEIGHQDAKPHGSIFWVDLPIAEDRPSREPKLFRTDNCARARAGGFSMLYVEDNHLNLQLVEYVVASLPKVTLHSAPTGSLGLDLAMSQRPDIVLLDLNLPDMSGIEVLGRLKGKPETGAIPVIALTASAMPEDVMRGTEAGFFRYLTKPLNFDAFMEAIDAALTGGDPADSKAPSELGLTAGTLDEDPLIDQDRFDQIRDVMGMVVFFEAATELCREIRRCSEEIREAVSRDDPGAAAALAHSLKGQCLNFGAVRLAQVSQRLILLGRNADISAMLELMNELTMVSDHTISEITSRTGNDVQADLAAC